MVLGQQDRVRLLEIASSVDGLAPWDVIPFAQALEAFVLGKAVPKHLERFTSVSSFEASLEEGTFSDFPNEDDKTH